MGIIKDFSKSFKEGILVKKEKFIDFLIQESKKYKIKIKTFEDNNLYSLDKQSLKFRKIESIEESISKILKKFAPIYIEVYDYFKDKKSGLKFENDIGSFIVRYNEANDYCVVGPIIPKAPKVTLTSDKNDITIYYIGEIEKDYNYYLFEENKLFKNIKLKEKMLPNEGACYLKVEEKIEED